MKSKFYSKDLSQILRRALSTALCLFLVWDSFTFVDAANVSVDDAKIIANQGYTWTWIKGPEQLYKYSWKSIIDYDTSKGAIKGYTVAANNGQKGSAYSQSYYDNDETHWTRAMILYTSNGSDWYMNAGSSMVDDGEIFSGKKVMTTYNIKPKEETFTTRKGYDTWFIKYAGEDSDNKEPMLYFRFSNQGNVLGSDMLVMNASWYGIKNHAAIYSELRKTSVSNPTSRKHNCFACSSSLIEAATLHFRSNGSLEIYYNVPGTFDKYWYHDDNPWEIETLEYDVAHEYDFYLYLGTPVKNSIVPTREVLPQTTAVYIDAVIEAGTTIEVKKGAYMALGGKCINNGRIIVNGGTLVIFGIVDSDVSGDVSVVDNVIPGSLEVKNGGVVIIEESATYLMRYSTAQQSAGLSVTGGSLLTCDGTLVVPGNVTINNSRVECRPGSAFLHNFVPNANTAGDAFARDAIWNIHQNAVLSNASYLSNFGGATWPSPWTLKVENNGSLYVYGLCYQSSNRSKYTVDASSYADFVAHTNINSKIVDMVRQW